MLYQRELKYWLLCNTLRSLWVMYGTQGTWWKGTWKKSKIQNTVTLVYILYTNIKNQIHPKHSAQGKLRSISLFSLAYEKYVSNLWGWNSPEQHKAAHHWSVIPGGSSTKRNVYWVSFITSWNKQSTETIRNIFPQSATKMKTSLRHTVQYKKLPNQPQDSDQSPQQPPHWNQYWTSYAKCTIELQNRRQPWFLK